MEPDSKLAAAMVVGRLRQYATDWDGEPLPRGVEPMDGIHCDLLYDAIAVIESLSADKLVDSVIDHANAELAEARAQIAAKDAALQTSMLNYTAMIRDLGAQIAAKDAALDQQAAMIDALDIQANVNEAQIALLQGQAKRALAPARETTP